MMLFWLSLCGLLPLLFGQQNAKEEAICAPFLTSPKTAPILDVQRNLTVDEDGEFSCELVLQDRFLPFQIRLTIHEGLHHLAVRHTQMGLHKAGAAARHARMLTEMQPRNADFQLKAGTWSIHPEVSDLEKAAFHFHSIVYGNATEKSSAQLRYQARKGYVRALAHAARLRDAVVESIALLEEFPYDMDAAFQVLDGWLLLESTELQERADRAVSRAKQLASLVARFETNSYGGFTAGRDTEIRRYDALLTVEQFLAHIARREPFVMNLTNVQSLEVLGWKVASWVNNEHYIVDKISEQVKEDWDRDSYVLVETPISNSHACEEQEGSSCYTYGYGLPVRRLSKAFKEVASGSVGSDVYLNVQLPATGQRPYNPPLHLVQDDIPVVDNPHPFFQAIRENITDINLWMGLQGKASKASSRLHRDALDNLYFVLEGHKQFLLYDPSRVHEMRTVSPTIAVHPQGLGYQLDASKLRVMLLQLEDHLLSHPLFQQSPLPPDAQTLRDFLSAPEVTYEADNLHFSTLFSSAAATVPTPSAVVDLQPGEVLYLPTGWFHRVTSSSSHRPLFSAVESEGMGQVIRRHLAINVWWRALDWENAQTVELEAMYQLCERIIAAVTATATTASPSAPPRNGDEL